MTNIRSFRELKVWKKAMDLAMEIFEITKRFPPEEKYALMTMLFFWPFALSSSKGEEQ
jgi:hypothetical protein